MNALLLKKALRIIGQRINNRGIIMTLDSFIKVLYKVGDWLAKLMFLQLLWVVFTLIGLGIFGVFPATSALIAVIYGWLDEHTDIPIYKTFYTAYKRNFLRANLLGSVIVGVSLCLYVNFRISQTFIQSTVFHYFLIFISSLFLIITLYLFTVFKRYHLSILSYFKQSFLIASLSPLESLALLISTVFLLNIFYNLPFLFILIGIPSLYLPVVWFSYRGCKKVEKTKVENEV